MKQRLAVDQDQVIADLLSVWIDAYNSDYNDNLKLSNITSWNFHEIVKKECGEKIYQYLDSQELFENLPVMEDSQAVLYDLSRKHEIYIVTAPWNPENVLPKTKWLKKHFSFIPEENYVFTRNKGIVNADWLIDDKPNNFNGFYGIPILYSAPHNRNENRFLRMNNWLEIRDYFHSMEDKHVNKQTRTTRDVGRRYKTS